MCTAAGFSALIGNPEVFERFDEIFRPPAYSVGPAGRAFVLSSVRRCIRMGGLRSRLHALVPDSDE